MSPYNQCLGNLKNGLKKIYERNKWKATLNLASYKGRNAWKNN
jgi:hypothetical protein